MFITFLIIRTLDLLSTYLNMSKYQGWEYVEAAPVSAGLIHVGYLWFVVINLTLSILLYWLLVRWSLSRLALKVFMVINLLVVISNFICFILI